MPDTDPNHHAGSESGIGQRHHGHQPAESRPKPDTSAQPSHRGVRLRPKIANRQRKRPQPMPDSDPNRHAGSESGIGQRHHGHQLAESRPKPDTSAQPSHRGVWLRPKFANRQRKRSRPMPDSDPNRSTGSESGIGRRHHGHQPAASRPKPDTSAQPSHRGVWLRPKIANRQRKHSRPMPDSEPQLQRSTGARHPRPATAA